MSSLIQNLICMFPEIPMVRLVLPFPMLIELRKVPSPTVVKKLLLSFLRNLKASFIDFVSPSEVDSSELTASSSFHHHHEVHNLHCHCADSEAIDSV